MTSSWMCARWRTARRSRPAMSTATSCPGDPKKLISATSSGRGRHGAQRGRGPALLAERSMQPEPGQSSDVAQHPIDPDPAAHGVQHGDEADQTGQQQDHCDQDRGLRFEVVPPLRPDLDQADEAEGDGEDEQGQDPLGEPVPDQVGHRPGRILTRSELQHQDDEREHQSGEGHHPAAHGGQQGGRRRARHEGLGAFGVEPLIDRIGGHLEQESGQHGGHRQDPRSPPPPQPQAMEEEAIHSGSHRLGISWRLTLARPTLLARVVGSSSCCAQIG